MDKDDNLINTVYTRNIDNQEDAVAILEEFKDEKESELAQALHRYDIVDVNYDPHGGSYIIVSERDPGTKLSDTGFDGIGFIDPSPFTAWTRLEHVPELRDKKGIRTFYDMSRSDGAVRGGLRVVKTPIQGAEWYIEPASESTIDANIASFVEKNLFEELDVPWKQFIEDCLRCYDYGFFSFEKEFGWEYSAGIRRLKLKSLHPVHPLDIQGWEYNDDGKLIGVRMEPIQGTDFHKQIIIPWGKVLHVTFEMEGGDLRGTSILRTAFKHFYFKDTMYRIDAIQKERHGIGVPLIKLPLGFTPKDVEQAHDLGRNLRTNEKAYIAVPVTWEVSFAKLEGQPVDPIPSIQHHDQKIYEAILASFMGSRDVSKESLDTFYKSTRYQAELLADFITRGVIRQLVDINFLRKGGYPKLCVRRMGEWEDTRTMTFALRNLAGAKFITPDEPMENLLRKQMGLPPLDKATARDIAPQTSSPAGSVKAPQPKASRQTNTPYTGAPQANAGTDKSGG